MYSAEHLQMAASGIVIMSIISNGCLETSLKNWVIKWLKFQKQPLDAISEKEFLKLSMHVRNN